MELILGSQSPRRRELLKQIGLEFTVRTAELEEARYVTEDPVETVCAICAAKARAVAAALEPAPQARLVLTSDTIVVLEGRIMGKPHTEAEAAAMLTALSGREHSVFTAFTLLPLDGTAEPAVRREPVTDYEETRVRFRRLTPEEIRAYIATGEPMDKAGAYGIQGLGALLAEGITGDYFTVMGLPLCRLNQRLKDYEINALKG